MISYRARLVTMDGTLLYRYDQETKQQLLEWQHSGSFRPKNFRLQMSTGNFLAWIFWDQDDILLINYLPKIQTINAEYYSSLLVQLKDILNEKRSGNFTNGGLVLARQNPGTPDTSNPEETVQPGLPVF